MLCCCFVLYYLIKTAWLCFECVNIVFWACLNKSMSPSLPRLCYPLIRVCNKRWRCGWNQTFLELMPILMSLSNIVIIFDVLSLFTLYLVFILVCKGFVYCWWCVGWHSWYARLVLRRRCCLTSGNSLTIWCFTSSSPAELSRLSWSNFVHIWFV